MTRDEFIGPFTRLITAFGLPRYVKSPDRPGDAHLPSPTDFGTEYFKHFSSSSASEWSQIVSQAIASCSFFPKIPELLDIRASLFPPHPIFDDEADIKRQQAEFRAKYSRAKEWYESLSPKEKDEVTQEAEVLTKKRWPGFLEFDADRVMARIARQNSLIELYETRYPYREKKLTSTSWRIEGIDT